MAALRRHPRRLQGGAVGAVAAGVLLFLIGTMITPLAGADTAHRHRDLAGTTTPTLDLTSPAPTAAASPAARKTLARNPTHVAKKAPVTHGVISGLAANGIPKVALNAYRVAAARLGNVQPGCGLGWYLLAGIGREESDHGQFAGAVLHADGVSTPRIVGPALDGVHWDYIPAPGNGAQLDGDARYAHALGPMQFIPSTWASYGADATGDGKADIFNINDAALGAARYLCAAGGNLRTHSGQVAAVLAYNHNDQYLAQVLALADAYRRGVRITGIPIGITKGPLPKVGDTGYIPPANPGAPTAVAAKKKTAPKSGSSASGKPAAAPSASKASSTAGHGGATPATSAPATSAHTTSQPASGSTTSPTPSPTPSPTKTCSVLEQLLGCKPS